MVNWLVAPRGQGGVRHLAVQVQIERGQWTRHALCGKTRPWRWSGRWAEQWPQDRVLPVCSRCASIAAELAAAAGDHGE